MRCAIVTAVCLATPLFGQMRITTPGTGGPVGPGVVRVEDPSSPASKARAAQALTRKEYERELKRIRAKYFRSMRNVEIRQIGISRLREMTDPVMFPLMLEVFRREKDDVRVAILDHLRDLETDEGDATVAWVAVFEDDKWFRDAATDRLRGRYEAWGGADVPVKVQTAVARGLKSKKERVISSAARLANTLNLVNAIPALINTQVAPQDNGEGQTGALADILVATQQAFIADLEPVVGDSAVAFDPELGVVTNGTILRVLGAYVITYRTEVHRELVDLTSRAWGKPTDGLGWDSVAWRKWYAFEFEPFLIEREAAEAAAEAAGTMHEATPEESVESPTVAPPLP